MMGAGQLALTQPVSSTDYGSDAELLAACQRQEVRAFEQLYRLHGPRLKSIAYHIAGNRQDAEDAVQETFLKLYRAIHGFQGHSSLGTWLCRIVINVCYDQSRKRQRETQLEEAPTPARERPSGPPLRAALESALRRINPRHRMVFLLFEVEGLKHAEIASVLEIPEGTSKAWLFEARKELQKLLGEARP